MSRVVSGLVVVVGRAGLGTVIAVRAWLGDGRIDVGSTQQGLRWPVVGPIETAFSTARIHARARNAARERNAGARALRIARGTVTNLALARRWIRPRRMSVTVSE